MINGQVQLGDVFAEGKLQVDSAEQTVTSATAVGNIASATAAGGAMSFTSTQAASGGVKAVVTASVAGSSGAYAGATASATGNAATAGTCCGPVSGSSRQTAGPKDIVSGAYLDVGKYAYQLSNDAASVGNTQGWLSTNGAVRAFSSQTLTGSVTADASTRAGEVETVSGTSATAVGNDVTTSSANGTVDLVTEQSNTGFSVKGQVTVQQAAGDTVAGMATATSNNITVENQGGASLSAHTQTSSAEVVADSAVGLGAWNSATVGSYGVGNSAYGSNVGPTTEFAADQTNTGPVTARSLLTASNGGAEGYVSATAVGNAIQASACQTCDGGVGFKGNQLNAGAVTASTSYKGPATGSVIGAASAVGNSATYVVRTPSS